MVRIIHWPLSVTLKRTDKVLARIFSVVAHLKDTLLKDLDSFTHLNNINRVICNVRMKRYNLSILGVNEMRLNTFGLLWTTTGETIWYSGKPKDDDPHVKGVGLILSIPKQSQKCTVTKDLENIRRTWGQMKLIANNKTW